MSLLDRFVPWRFRSRENFVKAHANYFFRDVLRTGPLRTSPASETEAHVLVCHRDVNMCILAIKSFLRYVDDVSIVIHDDGSLTGADSALFEKHILGARLIPRSFAGRQASTRSRRRHVEG